MQKFEIASVALDLSREIAAVLTQNIGMAARELAAMNREIGASLRKFAESPEAILFSDRSTADEKMVAAAALAKRLPIKPKNPAARAALMRLAKQRGKRLTKMAPRKWRGGEEFAEWVRSEVLVPAVLRAAKDAYVSQPVRIGKDWIGGSSKFEVVPMKLPVQLAWIWLRQRANRYAEEYLAEKPRKRLPVELLDLTEAQLATLQRLSEDDPAIAQVLGKLQKRGLAKKG